MRVRLITDKQDVLNNFLNLSPFVQEETNNIKRSTLINIDDFVGDGQAEELHIIHTIETIPANTIYNVFTGWVNKVKIGGKIVIIGTDARILCKEFGLYYMELEDLNTMLYGIFNERKCILTIDRVVDFLKSANFTIIKKEINEINYFIEGVRN